MKTIKIALLVLLIAGILAKETLICSSQSGNSVSRTDQKIKSSIGKPRGPRKTPDQRKVLIFGAGGRENIEEASNIRVRANSQNRARENADEQDARVVGAPNQQQIEAKYIGARPSRIQSKSSRRQNENKAERALRNIKWSAPPNNWRYPDIVFMSPCFYNHCPRGIYTLNIRATCDFTVILVDENGNYEETIGSGSAWVGYTFQFDADCGQHRIKIILDCPCECACGCANVCYTLYQDQTDCWNCPNPELQYYDPRTCTCECSTTCQTCKPPQQWNEKICSCQCQRVQRCNSNQYWDGKRCRCVCLPKCCPWTPTNKPCGC